MKASLKVLIIGSGGREHALLKACKASPLVESVVAAPGNGGMEAEAPCHPLDVEDIEATVKLATELGINFAIVGPEVPLALGAADSLRAAGIDTYGPGRDGAVLESSKAACKAFFKRYDIPTAAWDTFSEVEPALEYARSCQLPLVVKASGLAAGKGVIICETASEAEEAIRGMLEGKQFGESGEEIVIEEFLTGQEASIMVMVSGNKYVCLPPSQDHKRIGEGDTGPNTGGMGAYAPAVVVTDTVMETVAKDIIKPTLGGFEKEGIDFRGTLFVGLMINDEGIPKVLEYNVRFGDPECQVLLPLCETDPVELMLDCARGTLEPQDVKIRKDYAMNVVLSAKGYPGSYAKGDIIQLPDELPDNVHIIHAGTRIDESGNLVSSGGRVLGVVSMASSLEAAARDAYAVCDAVKWENKNFRRDIGHRQLKSPAES
ncbi:phosphoribosylamine--glycine ligase [Puniceicoccales bacterium CK1056]|uniref:Phosphoribosylamine--glycine ligase n=1 Tax=Oceanipulchritudo coccoides TaxID=2706888 RepID=A0A6B2M410_9BACT|nr:phosphoribosylamine--glycine ligase [Oceanipulchritudo coccoides]NDV62390.1 phosphoribosylamine--glycine ligase [Oceanipulchritudo coccoides]